MTGLRKLYLTRRVKNSDFRSVKTGTWLLERTLLKRFGQKVGIQSEQENEAKVNMTPHISPQRLRERATVEAEGLANPPLLEA